MQPLSVAYSYQSYQYLSDGNYSKPEDSQQKTFEELQAKIHELENELLKQKEVAEKGSKILKIIWGDEFESDSLH